MNAKILAAAIFTTLLVISIKTANALTYSDSANTKISWWKFQSVDTMKYSRDVAREKLNDQNFDAVINQQVKAIAQTGATHVAIATPYDNEFIPFLKRWVKAARDNNLNVWFRGNFSGWEGWFEYSKITRDEHLAKTKQFIAENKDLFADGDIFTACPECENGGPGDPRQTGDVESYRKFLIDEYATTQTAFFKLNKAVLTNFNSMNGDVAKLIMDKKTTQSLGGIVTIDHYVETPKKLADDISIIATKSGGKVVLGEFGAPIPDINGKFTEDQQAKWLGDVLDLLAAMPEVYGMNYWTNTGSSTQLWNEDGKQRKAVETLTKYYSPKTVEITVKNELRSIISDATIRIENNNFKNSNKGTIIIPYIKTENLITIKAEGYKTQETSIERLLDKNEIIMTKENESIAFKFKKLLIVFLAIFSGKK